jgi:hypothetical protein
MQKVVGSWTVEVGADKPASPRKRTSQEKGKHRLGMKVTLPRKRPAPQVSKEVHKKLKLVLKPVHPSAATSRSKKEGGVPGRGQKKPEMVYKKDSARDKAIDDKYEVESILKKRNRQGILQYLIKWKNYGSEHATWEKSTNLAKCEDVLKEWMAKEEAEKRRIQDLKKEIARKKKEDRDELARREEEDKDELERKELQKRIKKFGEDLASAQERDKLNDNK